MNKMRGKKQNKPLCPNCPIAKSKKETKSIPLPYEYMTAHFHGLAHTLK